MDFKEAFKKIGELMSSKAEELEAAEAVEETTEEVVEESTEETAEKFEDAQLANGEVVSIEPAIEVGAAVMVNTEDGPVAAPNGEHELASGDIIVVAGGVITEIVAVEAEEEAEMEEVEVEQSTEKEEPTPKTVIERTEVERKFSSVDAELKAANIAIDGMVKRLTANNEIITELFKVVQAIADQPAAEPTVSKKDLRKAAAKKEADKHVADALAFAKAIKNKK